MSSVKALRDCSAGGCVEFSRVTVTGEDQQPRDLILISSNQKLQRDTGEILEPHHNVYALSPDDLPGLGSPVTTAEMLSRAVVYGTEFGKQPQAERDFTEAELEATTTKIGTAALQLEAIPVYPEPALVIPSANFETQTAA